MLNIENNFVKPDLNMDVIKVAVVERYGKSGGIGLGFVKGFNLKDGTLASTTAHDSHSIITIGVKSEDMLHAVKKIKEIDGRLIVAKNRRILASLKLNIAGLMSLKIFEKVCVKYKKVNKVAKGLGIKLNEPFIQMSFLALPVISEIRLRKC
jgi:adenine deaminase